MWLHQIVNAGQNKPCQAALALTTTTEGYSLDLVKQYILTSWHCLVSQFVNSITDLLKFNSATRLAIGLFVFTIILVMAASDCQCRAKQTLPSSSCTDFHHHRWGFLLANGQTMDFNLLASS